MMNEPYKLEKWYALLCGILTVVACGWAILQNMNNQ